MERQLPLSRKECLSDKLEQAIICLAHKTTEIRPMPTIRVFSGDENGITKSIKFSIPEGRLRADTEITTSVVLVDERPKSGKVQRMAVGQRPDGSRIVRLLLLEC